MNLESGLNRTTSRSRMSNSTENVPDRTLKLFFNGPGAAGKSASLCTVASGEFGPTVFDKCNINVKSAKHELLVSVGVWDTVNRGGTLSPFHVPRHRRHALLRRLLGAVLTATQGRVSARGAPSLTQATVATIYRTSLDRRANLTFFSRKCLTAHTNAHLLWRDQRQY